MEKELLELFEAAKRAADAATVDGVSSDGPQVSRCVDALNQLKTFPVTKDALVTTQVGKRLRNLTKHPKEKIQSMATNLLEIWKKVVIEETTKSKKNGSSDNNSLAKSEVVMAASVKIEKTSKENSKRSVVVSGSGNVTLQKKKVTDRDIESVKVEEICREEKQDSTVNESSRQPGTPKLTTLIKSNDATRDKVRELLLEALSKVASEADEDLKIKVNACDPIRVAVSVESKMFEKMGRSTGTQKFKYRSIIFNIRDPNNPDFRRKILLGDIEPEKIMTMTPEEMASDERQNENNKIKQKALFDCERGGQPKATTDQFRCGRCGQRKTTYYQMQTRSADEPMTTYVTCVNCNNHWKFC